ncbi:hypothetical protein LOK49_LG03G01820 [Camellia lanceoleosa]|uniref:Uncharacterized protein n=1 Tax=Camellia lanceoleosa TaxID=1840588 RepID=A0ACC0I8H0_9ERIC|nr:hypothetical protein LOK49_LG03G01820 [Camellia lanceoleosa]
MACNNKKPIQNQLVLERGSSNKVKNTSVARGRRTGYGAYYGPGVPMPPSYLNSAVMACHVPHPHVWAPPQVATPISAQMLSTSSNNMNQGSTKKLKRLDEVAMQVVNDNAKNYSGLFRRTRRMYFSAADRGEMMSMVYNWPADQVDMIVVTDGSRILSLSDLGLHGIGITIRKLDLYVAATGINPQRVSSCFT